MTSQFSDPSKVCILSGRFPPSEFVSSWNHRVYSRTHGYTFINCAWPTGASNPYLNKFHYVKEYIRLFDFVFWIDDDAFFIDLDHDLTALIPTGEAIASFCKSPTNKEVFTFLSSGQFLLKGGDIGLEFVDAVLDTHLEVVKSWWREDLGLYTKGDQDAIVYLAHEDARFKNRLDLHHYKAFNSRLLDLQKDPSNVFLLHFTGRRERKRADHETAMEILGRGPSLVSDKKSRAILSGQSETEALARFPTVNIEKPKPAWKKRKDHLYKKLKPPLRSLLRGK